MSGYSTTDTFGSMITEVITSLTGYTAQVDQVCTLAADIGPDDTAFTVDATDLARGILEIDEELIYVSSAVGGNVQLAPWGRGWRDTAKASHSAGAAVYVSPVYPRSVVAREVNNTVRAIYPDLFAVKTAELTVSASTWQYELPTDVERILSVEYRWDTLTGWQPVTSWEMVSSALTTDFPSGKFLSIHYGLPVGAKVHVTYAAEPGLLSLPGDEFAATTGLPSSSRDVIVLGTAARILPWIDTARVPVQSVQSSAVDPNNRIGSGVSLAAELRKQYQLALRAERDALYSKYPIRIHRTR